MSSPIKVFDFINIQILSQLSQYFLKDIYDPGAIEGTIKELFANPKGFLEAIFSVNMPQVRKNKTASRFWYLGMLSGVAFALLSDQEGVLEFIKSQSKISQALMEGENGTVH
jgi:hypothetical protein